MKFIGFLVILMIIAVASGAFLGIFLGWLAEKKAKAETQKHDEEVARKMCEKHEH